MNWVCVCLFQSEDDDEDTFKAFDYRGSNKNLHLSDLELTDSDESSGISLEYAGEKKGGKKLSYVSLIIIIKKLLSNTREKSNLVLG